MAKPPEKTNKTKTQSKRTPATRKTTNAVKKDDIDKVKQTKIATESKPSDTEKVILTPEEVLSTVVDHISSIVRIINNQSENHCANVTEIIHTAIGELEKANKLGKMDPKSKKLRQDISNAGIFIEDQKSAMEYAKLKY